MAQASDRVRITVEDHIAVVTLTRAEKHNGMDWAMLSAVNKAQREVRRLKNVRAVVLRGEGPSFCAGLDFGAATKRPMEALGKYPQLFWPVRNQFQKWSVGWRDLGVPVIAVVHGNCFGAGLQLALGADVRFCTPDAKLSIMESKWGLIPDMGGIATLRELVRIDVAKELTFTGRVISGEEAGQLGLVTHVTDDPEAAARALAQEIATRSPDAIAAGKFLLQEGYGGSSHEVLAAERRWQRKLLGFANFRVALARNRSGKEIPYQDRSIRG